MTAWKFGVRQMIWFCVFGCGVLGVGCSGFRGTWRDAERAGVTPVGMEGRWEGQWLSESNGHHGRLRCVVTRQSNDVYQAWFHAKYWGCLSFAYKVGLRVEEEETRDVFHGEEDLGRLAGGVYHYSGWATATNFFSTYRCSRDHGTFQMTRPGGGMTNDE